MEQPDEIKASATPIRPDIRVGFLLMNQFTLHTVAQLIDPLRFAADIAFGSRQIFCQWEWMTCDNRPVVSSCGMPVAPTAPLKLDDSWDYVVLAGGLLEETRNPPEWLLEALRSLHARRVPIITLCSGSFVVGKAGLLDGKRCAIHFTTRDEFKERFPRVTPIIDQTYISDGGIISTPGGISVELAVDIIRRHCGEARAQKVLKYLMTEAEQGKKPMPARYRLDEKQTGWDDRLVQRTTAYMQQHLDSPEPLQQLSKQMKVTLRQLNQAFLRSTGDTAAAHWRKLRLEKARRLMTDSDYSIHAIAKACGFADASHLITWFRKHYGETPSGFRRRRRDVERILSPE